jgi:F420-dependent oxidoreductase-like protein
VAMIGKAILARRAWQRRHRVGARVEAGGSLKQAVARARYAEGLGYDSIWVSQLPDARDATIVLAAYARATRRAGLGTAVLPIYTRHPTAMAQVAATLDELAGGRFRLGIGVSHKVTVEDIWGLRLERPVEAMREYLTILRSSLRDGSASFDGRHFSARWAYSAPRGPDLPLLISALNPRMLELAGELADGVMLWMCSPSYVRDHVVPRVRAGRERAGKRLDGFEVAAGVPVCLTSDPEAGREAFRATVARYAGLPFYRRMMEASGFADQLARNEIPDAMVDELGGIGDEEAVRGILRRYREAGCTLPIAGPFSGHAGARGFELTLKAAITA